MEPCLQFMPIILFEHLMKFFDVFLNTLCAVSIRSVCILFGNGRIDFNTDLIITCCASVISPIFQGYHLYDTVFSDNKVGRYKLALFTETSDNTLNIRVYFQLIPPVLYYFCGAKREVTYIDIADMCGNLLYDNTIDRKEVLIEVICRSISRRILGRIMYSKVC